MILYHYEARALLQPINGTWLTMAAPMYSFLFEALVIVGSKISRKLQFIFFRHLCTYAVRQYQAV